MSRKLSDGLSLIILTDSVKSFMFSGKCIEFPISSTLMFVNCCPSREVSLFWVLRLVTVWLLGWIFVNSTQNFLTPCLIYKCETNFERLEYSFVQSCCWHVIEFIFDNHLRCSCLRWYLNLNINFEIFFYIWNRLSFLLSDKSEIDLNVPINQGGTLTIKMRLKTRWDKNIVIT